MLELGKQIYIFLSSDSTIHSMSCNQGGGNNTPLQLTSQCPKTCTNAALCIVFGWALLEQVRKRCLWEMGPEHPAAPLIPLPFPTAPGSCFHCSLCYKGPCCSSFTFLFPSCPSTSFKHNDPASIYLVLCSICCSNIKHEKSQSPCTKAKILFRVCCYCRVHLHYQSEIKARCFAEDFRYSRCSFTFIWEIKQTKKKPQP